MPSYETLKFEKDPAGFAVITLNRPASLNAISVQMYHELQVVFNEVMKDKDIKAFIYTGSPRTDGRPCFSAGMDLKEVAKGIHYDHPELKGPFYLEQDVMFPPNSAEGKLWRMRPRLPVNPVFMPHVWAPKVSIAAVDGVATAGGIELALCCDIILASETAQFSDMHVKNLGVGIGGGVVTANLAYRVGVAMAEEICFLGEPINGREAERIGLANHCYAPDKLLPAAKEMARKIAAKRLGAVSITKLSCRSIYDMSYNESWAYGDRLLEETPFEPGGPGVGDGARDWESKQQTRERSK